MKTTLIIAFLFLFSIVNAQCPVITCPNTLTLTNCQIGQTINASSNYSANITSRWIGPGNIPLASTGTHSSSIYINHVGTYTVEFRDNFSNCVVFDTVAVTTASNALKPTFDLSQSDFTVCVGSVGWLSITNGSFGNPNSPFPPGGPISYTITGPPTSSTIPSGFLSSASIYTLPMCGNWITYVREGNSLCTSTFDVSISCSTIAPTPIIFAGTNSVCIGSSASYTSTNALNNFNGVVMPTVSSVYNFPSKDLNGCNSSGNFAVNVNTNCSQVWPGDANSDGIVNNIDVLELGLAFSSTGPVRTPGGNAYVSQYANNWTGSTSTGKNRCHVDCNGDGVINNPDTLAIFNNFNLSHAFKPSKEKGQDPDIFLISPQSTLSAGVWNSVQIHIGKQGNDNSQLYGLAFDLDFDASLIVTDSIYVRYPNSFLNNNNQNIDFRKAVFNNGKVFAASVRTDGADVNGQGQIAEIHFKLKFNLPENSLCTFSVSNANKINNVGVSSNLLGEGVALPIDNNAVGTITHSMIDNSVRFFPNPAKGTLQLQNDNLVETIYFINDLSGRLLLQGNFTQSKNLDLSNFDAGIYLLQFIQDGVSICKKLVVE